MSFSIEWGAPEMAALWMGLLAKFEAKTLDGDETRLLKKLRKTVLLLAPNPAHPGLRSHEIDVLSKRYGEKVWQSYLENRTPCRGALVLGLRPGAGRHHDHRLGAAPRIEQAQRLRKSRALARRRETAGEFPHARPAWPMNSDFPRRNLMSKRCASSQ